MYEEKKHKLLEEIREAAGSDHMTLAKAEYMCVCAGAYKAMCLIGGEHEDSGELTEEEARAWMEHIVNEDGTTGARFTLEQAAKALPGVHAYCAWAALNATYSDIGEELKRNGVTGMDAIGAIARAYWFDDSDAVPHKLGAYYRDIVRK